jgi:hypothetical protein
MEPSTHINTPTRQQTSNRPSTSRVRLRQQPKLPRLRIVIATIRIRVQPLIQIPQLTPPNRQRLINIRPHHLPMANMLGPRRPTKHHIRAPRKRIRLGSRELCPSPADAAGSPGAEVAVSVRGEGFDEEEILGGAFDFVDVGGFEEGVLRVLQGDDGLGHAVREGGEGGLRAEEVAVVVGGEEVAGGCVADHPHVDPGSA